MLGRSGTATTLLGIGFLVIALQVAIPDGFARGMELGIGVLLVLLGIANLLAATPGSALARAPDAPLRASLARSSAIGLAHGLAGSAPVALLAMAAMPTPAAALAYLVVFGLGTIAGMVAFSLALGAPIARLGASAGLLALGHGRHRRAVAALRRLADLRDRLRRGAASRRLSGARSAVAEKLDAQTVREWGRRYSNWGRWGKDDERGTLNFITPARVLEACALPRSGRVISCALPFDQKGPANRARRPAQPDPHDARRRRRCAGGRPGLPSRRIPATRTTPS